MREIIEKILNEYVESKKEPFTGHSMGEYFRNTVPRLMYDTGIINSKDYLVKGSVGQGNWAMVPWICIFNRKITTSATKGVYIVYLLEKNGKSLYLTLNQGCTEIRRTHNKRETIQIMRNNAASLISKIDSRGFLSDDNISLGDGLTELAELYQKGTIFYKEYKKDEVPKEEELGRDLKNMIDIYQEYMDTVIQHTIGKFDSWEIINETTAIKTCDKSFFEHNGSGVPKGICWFFGAENLKLGESIRLKLIFKNLEYIGRISNESSDRRRVRIFWNADLGKEFVKTRGTSLKAKFIRTDETTYEITMEGDEAEVIDSNTKEALAKIKSYILSRGFDYSEGLIENFYLSLKSKPFVILAGTSGTGKTRLAKLFAEAIGAKFELVSVRPDWSDGNDLFGHTDLNGNFISGPICSAFETAINDFDKPVFLCLDEMNLARVEYYLSDILSVIESREKENGHVVTKKIAQYEDGIPDNLYIIGTVNMDETTFPFSKKVLDRANTIEFSYVDLMPKERKEEEIKPLELTNDFLRTEYLVLAIDCMNDKEFVTRVCTELQALNSKLVKANAQIGFRVRDEIVFYMLNNRKADDLLTYEQAMDNEIMQKILPRIQGSTSAIKTLLIDMFKFCMGSSSGIDPDTGNVGEQMKTAAASARYPESARKIGYMMTRFEDDGFTSYWL